MNMHRTREDLERYSREGVFRSDYVLPNLSYLPPQTMKKLRNLLTSIRQKWRRERLLPSHFPMIVESKLITDLSPHFNPNVQPTSVYSARRQRPHGCLPIAGGCLQGVPWVRKAVQSYRQLPIGVYTTDFAVSPHNIPIAVSGYEDIVCINGIYLRGVNDTRQTEYILSDLCADYGLVVETSEGLWWFNVPATIFQLIDGHIVAVVQNYSTVGGPDLGIKYLDKENKLQEAQVEFFYISQDALLLISDMAPDYNRIS